MTEDSFYIGRSRKMPEPDRVLPKGLLTAGIAVAFAGILWYAYPQGAEKYTDVNIPIITADSTPYKSKPENPGGMDVPHQDSTVFDSLNKTAAKKPEKVMVKKEEPVDKSKLAGLSTKPPQLILEPQSKPAAAAPPALPAKQDISAAPPVVKKAAAIPPAAKKEEAKPVVSAAYIQLGAYKTEGDAKADWARLQKKFPDDLKALPFRTQKVDLGDKGVLYRLQAGVASKDKAKGICDGLTKAKTACLVVK